MRNRDLAGSSREFPREYVRLKQIQNPGRNDFVTRVRVPQKAAFSGASASCHIAPNRFSSAKVSIPAEKHQVATERRPRQAAATARAALNMAAPKPNAEFRVTIRSALM
jgi:hypothetical protein